MFTSFQVYKRLITKHAALQNFNWAKNDDIKGKTT